MRYSKEVIIDSYAGEELADEEVHEVTIYHQGEAIAMDLSEENWGIFQAAMDPFYECEQWRPARITYPRLATERQDASKRKQRLTKEERQAVAAFVQAEKLGTVSRGGLVKQAYIDAWEAAGRPGI